VWGYQDPNWSKPTGTRSPSQTPARGILGDLQQLDGTWDPATGGWLGSALRSHQPADISNSTPTYQFGSDGPSDSSAARLPLLGSGPTQLQGEGSFKSGERDFDRLAARSGRSGNMGHCLPLYMRCQSLHGGNLLINGKRCQDCFNMCTLNGEWPFQFCPLRPF
jgi:hypothetical protein